MSEVTQVKNGGQTAMGAHQHKKFKKFEKNSRKKIIKYLKRLGQNLLNKKLVKLLQKYHKKTIKFHKKYKNMPMCTTLSM